MYRGFFIHFTPSSFLGCASPLLSNSLEVLISIHWASPLASKSSITKALTAVLRISPCRCQNIRHLHLTRDFRNGVCCPITFACNLQKIPQIFSTITTLSACVHQPFNQASTPHLHQAGTNTKAGHGRPISVLAYPRWCPLPQWQPLATDAYSLWKEIGTVCHLVPWQIECVEEGTWNPTG